MSEALPLALTETLANWRHHFHRRPETGFKEQQTSEHVAAQLQRLGIEVHRGIGGTGLVGVLRRGNFTGRKTIALRAEMDALPIPERAEGRAYASESPAPCTPAATTATWQWCSARRSCWRWRVASRARCCSCSSPPNAVAATTKVVGAARVDGHTPPMLASEDFGTFLRHVPGNFAFIGNGAPGEPGGLPLHNAGYDFNDSILAVGAEHFTTLVRDRLAVV